MRKIALASLILALLFLFRERLLSWVAQVTEGGWLVSIAASNLAQTVLAALALASVLVALAAARESRRSQAELMRLQSEDAARRRYSVIAGIVVKFPHLREGKVTVINQTEHEIRDLTLYVDGPFGLRYDIIDVQMMSPGAKRRIPVPWSVLERFDEMECDHARFRSHLMVDFVDAYGTTWYRSQDDTKFSEEPPAYPRLRSRPIDRWLHGVYGLMGLLRLNRVIGIDLMRGFARHFKPRERERWTHVLEFPDKTVLRTSSEVVDWMTTLDPDIAPKRVSGFAQVTKIELPSTARGLLHYWIDARRWGF